MSEIRILPDYNQITPLELETIFSPIKQEIRALEKWLRKWSDHSLPVIKIMSKKVMASPGKLIRPGLLLLVAKHLGYEAEDKIKLAATVEVIHTASLIHDDIIDNSTIRRGRKTAVLNFGPDFSLLLGDYLFIRSIGKSLSLSNKNLTLILTRVAEEMVEGEIEELSQSFNFDLTENQYYQIINKKTAGLFRATAELACYLARAKEKDKKSLISYGRYLGQTFQITDDLLDLIGNSTSTGKNKFSDLKEGRVTLPLILALKNLTPEEKKFWRSQLEKFKSEPAEVSPSDILSLMEKTGSLEQTFKKAEEKAKQAKKAAGQLADTIYRRSLLELVDFVLYRNK